VYPKKEEGEFDVKFLSYGSYPEFPDNFITLYLASSAVLQILPLYSKGKLLWYIKKK